MRVEFNEKIKKLESEMDTLATQIETASEDVDAQMELLEAKQKRRTVVRPLQDSGALVEP